MKGLCLSALSLTILLLAPSVVGQNSSQPPGEGSAETPADTTSPASEDPVLEPAELTHRVKELEAHLQGLRAWNLRLTQQGTGLGGEITKLVTQLEALHEIVKVGLVLTSLLSLVALWLGIRLHQEVGQVKGKIQFMLRNETRAMSASEDERPAPRSPPADGHFPAASGPGQVVGDPIDQQAAGVAPAATADRQVAGKEPTPEPPPPPVAPAEQGLSADGVDFATLLESFASMPHGDVGSLLTRLHRTVPKLARGFAQPAVRERFRQEFGAPLVARLTRFTDSCERGEDYLRKHWVGPDLVATLDALARYLSVAIEDNRRGHAAAQHLAEEVNRWLYDEFGRVCRQEGWFGIDPVMPFVTRFDPEVHHAVGGRDVSGASGLVVAVEAIGQLDPRRGGVRQKTAVIVGR